MSPTFVAGFILVQIIIFAVVIFVLRQLMYRDTLSAVNRLRLVDDENAKRIEEVKKKIQQAEEEYRKKLQQTAEEIRKQHEKARVELEEEREKTIARAREESDRIVSGAKKLEARSGEKKAKEMEVKARSIALEIVSALFGGEMAGVLDEQLIRELIGEIDALDAERLSVDFDGIEIIIRTPLSAAYKSQIQKIIESKTGRKLTVAEEIKKDMIGGIVLKLGSLIIDGSMENRIKETADELRRKA